MDIKWNKLVSQFIIISAFVSLIVILTAACVNYFGINSRVHITTEDTLQALENTKSTIDATRSAIDTMTIGKTDSIVSILLNFDNVQKETFDAQERIFNEYKTKIKDLNIGIFDSNVLTFTISFLLVFLGSMLLAFEKSAKEQIKEAKEEVKDQLKDSKEEIKQHFISQEKIMEEKINKSEQITGKQFKETTDILDNAQKTLRQLQIEQTTLGLNTQIQALRLFSTNIQILLASNSYNIDNSINIQIRELFTMTEDLLNEFRNEKYKYISKEWKSVFDKNFNKLISSFEIEKIRRNPNNDHRTRPIEMTVDKLEELRGEISMLKETDIFD